MPTRRTLVATVGTLGLAATAGCVDAVLGDGVEVSAEPAAVRAEPAADANYERASVESTVVEREIGLVAALAVPTGRVAPTDPRFH